MLDITDAERTRLAVYPTTRLGYYKKGMDVSWEWSFEPTIREPAYYLDMESNTFKYAFGASADFVGRNIKELLVP
jgi:hypothetical protein